MEGDRLIFHTTYVTTLHVSEAVAALDPALVMGTVGVSGPHDQLMAAASGSPVLAQLAALFGSQPRGFAMRVDQEVRVTTGFGDTDADDDDPTITRSAWRVTEFTRGGVTRADVTIPAGHTVADLRLYRDRLRAGSPSPPNQRP